MSEFAQVKFLTDSLRTTVPTSFFKVVFNRLMSPGELTIGNVYQVFWSPEEEETPTDVMESSNEILDVDDLPELEKSRKRRQSGPLKGFYNALLLSLSHTEETEREYKRELSESNCLPSNAKRVKAPSDRALEAINSKMDHRPGTSKGDSNKASSKKSNKLAAVEATKRNLTSLFIGCSNVKKGKTQITASHSTPMQDGAMVKKNKSATKEDSAKVTKNNCVSKKDVAKVSKDNPFNSEQDASRSTKEKAIIEPQLDAEYWKNKYLESVAEKEKPILKIGQDKAGNKGYKMPKDKNEKAEKDLELTRPNSPASEENDISHDDRWESILENGDKFDVNEDGYLGKGDKKNDKKNSNATEGSGDADKLSSTDTESDDEVFNTSKRSTVIPHGQAGDSLALYAFADKLWDPSVIVKRSPTGLAAASKGCKVAYPKMTPLKVKKCEDFLKQRVLEENKDASKHEIDIRVGRTRYILGQKIASLRKSYRRQSINIPTAEEAQNDWRREKRERKKLNKRSSN